MSRSLMPPAAIRILALVLALGAGPAHAQIPRTFQVQGVLSDSVTGQPLTTPTELGLKLYTASSGGDLLVQEIDPLAMSEDGSFVTTFGDQAVLQTPFMSRQLWLGYTFDPSQGGTELAPRLEVLAAPHAIRTRVAERIFFQQLLAPHSGDSSHSGDRLMEVLSGITDASVSKPYEVLLSPGTYSMPISSDVALPAYTTLRGAGIGTTEILLAQDHPLLPGDHSSVRDLTLRGDPIGVHITSGSLATEVSLLDVRVECVGIKPGFHTGVLVEADGGIRLERCEIHVQPTSTGAVIHRGVAFFGTDSSGTPMVIRDTHIKVWGSSSYSAPPSDQHGLQGIFYAFTTGSCPLELEDVWIEVFNQGTGSVGGLVMLSSSGARARVRRLRVRQSAFGGLMESLSSEGGDIQVFSSYLGGPVNDNGVASICGSGNFSAPYTAFTTGVASPCP